MRATKFESQTGRQHLKKYIFKNKADTIDTGVKNIQYLCSVHVFFSPNVSVYLFSSGFNCMNLLYYLCAINNKLFGIQNDLLGWLIKVQHRYNTESYICM